MMDKAVTRDCRREHNENSTHLVHLFPMQAVEGKGREEYTLYGLLVY